MFQHNPFLFSRSFPSYHLFYIFWHLFPFFIN